MTKFSFEAFFRTFMFWKIIFMFIVNHMLLICVVYLLGFSAKTCLELLNVNISEKYVVLFGKYVIVFWLVFLEKCSSLKRKIIHRTCSWSKQSWHDFSCLVRFPDKVYSTTAHDSLLHWRPKFLVNIKLFVSFPGKIWFTIIQSCFWLIILK